MSRIWTVKIGSSLLVDRTGGGVNTVRIQALIDDVVALRDAGVQVVLVSSGAVVCGMVALKLKTRPRRLPQLQAAAAVGQSLLVRHYQEALDRHDIRVGQLLLTGEDRENRTRYLNARNTLEQLFRIGAVPLINENDTVATGELRFGDNDRLAAMAADLSGSEALVILTDCDGLHEADPRRDSRAKLIRFARASDPALDEVAAPGDTELGRGGMFTKLQAARMAARAGMTTWIAHGELDQPLLRIFRGAAECTELAPDPGDEMRENRRWMASSQGAAGALYLDEGACNELRSGNSSLLAVGVISAEGGFVKGDIVQCFSASGQLLARGRAGYSAEELRGAITDDRRAGLPPIIRREHLVWLAE
ncbi:MAG: glutamate 5-kinase [Gammaproteobacteria bacterium AqS3]|nr:glutamate 5-kinase [Gammaproteobacteria bacterium AqS3]